MAWQTSTHSDYQEKRWKTVRAHLDGEILERLDKYLIRKRQGEADEAYQVRQDIASYVPHYMRAVLTLVGMILQNEPDAERTWWEEGTALGAPDQDGSVIGEIQEDVDGQGMDWQVMVAQVLTTLTGYQRVWGLVDGVERQGDMEQDGPPTMADAASNGRIRYLNPLSVTDWARDDSGRLVEVQVKSMRDERTSVKAEEGSREQYHIYGLEGVEVWVEAPKASDDDWIRKERRPYGPNGFQYIGRDGRPVLPIWKTEVPTQSPVGYMMARYASWLFNFRNVRNFHMWSSALARGWVDATGDEGRFDEDLWTKFQELLQEGSSFFPKEVGYSAPPMEGADTRNDIYEQERDDFYTVFFQSYADAAAQKTATEVMQDIAQGVAAYLTLESTAMDEWENSALWRLAQVHMPNAGPEVWGQASVERDRSWTDWDLKRQIEELRKGAFGDEPVPLGTEGRVEAAKRYADLQGISVVEEEVRSDVKALRGRQSGGLSALTDRMSRLGQRAEGETPAEESENGEL